MMKNFNMKYFRVVSKEFNKIDDSLYIERKVDALGRGYWVQIENYTSVPKGRIYKTRIRKSVCLAGIACGNWVAEKKES